MTQGRLAEAEVIIVAASRDQADILRREAEKLVKRSGKQVATFSWDIAGDVYAVKTGYREIRYGENRMRVLAADAATGDGALPTLALVDELHRHRSMELYGVLADGLEAPAPSSPGAGGSLKDFAEFCGNLILDTGKPFILEPHEKEILRPYFKGVKEIAAILSKKNGKTTLLAALGLYHLKVGAKTRQMVTISTAGMKKDSPLGVLRTKAHALPSFKRKGAKNTASSADGSFVWLEWCLSEEDDLTNMKLVKKANPASWHTVSSLRRRYDSPAMTPGRWARFACGVWTEGEDSWIEPKEWDVLTVDIGKVTPGERVCVAVGIGTNPAIALAAPRPEGAVAVKVEIYEGDVPLEQIEKRLVELSEAYELEAVAFDKATFLRSAELLEQRGLPMVETPHSPERLSIVTQTLRRLIESKSLRHDGDTDLRAQVLAGSTKETERGLRLVSTYQTRGLIAMAFAAHRATQVTTEPPRSKYEDEGMAVL